MGGRPGVNGADLFDMPFECPIDVILSPHHLYHGGLAYRQERWLTHARVPAALRNSREPVLVVDQRDAELRAARDLMVRPERQLFQNRHSAALGQRNGAALCSGSFCRTCAAASVLRGTQGTPTVLRI